MGGKRVNYTPSDLCPVIMVMDAIIQASICWLLHSFHSKLIYLFTLVPEDLCSNEYKLRCGGVGREEAVGSSASSKYATPGNPYSNQVRVRGRV